MVTFLHLPLKTLLTTRNPAVSSGEERRACMYMRTAALAEKSGAVSPRAQKTEGE